MSALVLLLGLLSSAAAAADTEGPAALARAETCLRAEDHECAKREAEAALSHLPENSRAHSVLAKAIRIKMQDQSRWKAMFAVGGYKKALARAIELDPQNVDARVEQIGFFLEAPAVAGGSRSRAQEAIDELRGVSWRDAQRMQIRLHRKSGDRERELAAYDEALERQPDDHQTRLDFAFALQRAERFRDADRQLVQLAEVEDSRLVGFALYGRARGRILGGYELEEAVGLLRTYIERHASGDGLPSPSSAWWRMGGAYEGLGRLDQARECYEKALELDPKSERARAALGALP